MQLAEIAAAASGTGAGAMAPKPASRMGGDGLPGFASTLTEKLAGAAGPVAVVAEATTLAARGGPAPTSTGGDQARTKLGSKATDRGNLDGESSAGRTRRKKISEAPAGAAVTPFPVPIKSLAFAGADLGSQLSREAVSSPGLVPPPSVAKAADGVAELGSFHRTASLERGLPDIETPALAVSTLVSVQYGGDAAAPVVETGKDTAESNVSPESGLPNPVIVPARRQQIAESEARAARPALPGTEKSFETLAQAANAPLPQLPFLAAAAGSGVSELHQHLSALLPFAGPKQASSPQPPSGRGTAPELAGESAETIGVAFEKPPPPVAAAAPPGGRAGSAAPAARVAAEPLSAPSFRGHALPAMPAELPFPLTLAPVHTPDDGNLAHRETPVALPGVPPRTAESPSVQTASAITTVPRPALQLEPTSRLLDGEAPAAFSVDGRFAGPLSNPQQASTIPPTSAVPVAWIAEAAATGHQTGASGQRATSPLDGAGQRSGPPPLSVENPERFATPAGNANGRATVTRLMAGAQLDAGTPKPSRQTSGGELALAGVLPGSSAWGSVPGHGAGVAPGWIANPVFNGPLAREAGRSFESVGREDPFSHLDSGTPVAGLPSGPRAVAVGVDDPAHGWLEIRAEGATGQVTASLHAASPEAHAALHAQLSGMAQYLAEREIGVRTIEVSGGQGGGLAGDGGAGPGGEGRTGHAGREQFSGGSSDQGSSTDIDSDRSAEAMALERKYSTSRRGSDPPAGSDPVYARPRHLFSVRV